MSKQLVEQFREWAKARRGFLISEIVNYDILTGGKLDILVNRDLEKYRVLPKYKKQTQNVRVSLIEGCETAEDIELISIAYLNEIEVLDQVIASYNNICASKPISNILVFMDILITYVRDYQVDFEDAAQLLGMLIHTNGEHNTTDYFQALGKCFTATGKVNIKELDNASFASNFLMAFSQILLEETLGSEKDFNEIKVRSLMKYYLSFSKYKSIEDVRDEPKVEEKSIKKVESNMLRDYYRDGIIVNVCYDVDMFTQLLKEADKSNAEIKKLSKMMKAFTNWLEERETVFYKAKEYLNEEEVAILNYFEDFLSVSPIKDGTYYTVKAAVEAVMSPIIFAYNTSCDSELTEELNEYIKEEVKKEMQVLRGIYQLFREESKAKDKLSYPKNAKALNGLFKSLESMSEEEYKSAVVLMQQLGEEMSLKPCDIGLIDDKKLSLVANDSSIIVYTVDASSNTFKILGVCSTEAGISSIVKTVAKSASLEDDLKPEEQLKDEDITKNIFNGLNEKGQELKYKRAE